MDKISVISLRNVSKYYKLYDTSKDRLKEALHPFNKLYHKKYFATKGLNLEINKGDVLGVVGKNGSGKSTLLKLITGVLQPSSGEVKIDGKISALLELGSGFNPEFTGIQNIFFYGTILGFSRYEMENKLEKIIDFAELGDFINQPLKTYSSGMKTRLGFSVAVHIDPEILILDEVLSVGDIHFKRKSYAKMQEFFEAGKTIIYVSHASEEINRLCNRAIMLHDGEIVMEGEPKEVTKQYEKYLFTRDEDQKKSILENLKNLQGLQGQHIDIEVKKQLKKSFNTKKTCLYNEKDKGTADYLIPDFESKNKLEYSNGFLKIEDIHIEDLDGIIVNALILKKRYVYCYRLDFLQDYLSVDFGMQIQNDKGVLISGCKQEQSLDFFEGDSVTIRWEFDCLLKEGVYYTSIGVNSMIDGKREYINRIVDAMMFKVLPVDNCCNGMVYLNQSRPQVIRNNEEIL